MFESAIKHFAENPELQAFAAVLGLTLLGGLRIILGVRTKLKDYP